MKSFLFSFVILTTWTNLAQCANQLFHNGKIYTEVGTPTSNWLLLKNSRVHSFGKGPLPTLDPDAEKIDLKGKILLPSITDAHVHLTDIGREQFQIDLRGTKSAQEVIDRLQKALKEKRIKAPNVIVGNGWDQSDWPEQKFPTRAELDNISTEQPIILQRIDGHAVWVNTYALKESKIWNETIDPKGGKIHRGADNLPSGILVDNAMDKLKIFQARESSAQIEEYIQVAVGKAQSLGITGMHDAGATGPQIEAIRNLLRKKKLNFRFYEMISFSDTPTFERYLASGPEIDGEEGQLNVRAVKFYADGAMGSRGAAFKEPYSDDPKNKGLLNMEESQMVEAFTKADEAGFQIAVHAIGSLGNHLSINALEKALGPTIQSKRPRLEHTQVLDKNDIARIAKLGIIASMQPVHATSDMKWVVQRIGKKRARYSYAWNSLLKAKATLAFGSDAPMDFFNPWHGLFAAVTRQDKDFQPKNGFIPEEKISFQDAYKAFTTGAATASFSELMVGKLSNGAWADFIVMGKDPFASTPEEVRNLEVDETWIGGKKVFEKTSKI